MRRPLGVVAVLAFGSAGSLPAQSRVITGHVIDAVNGAPLARAQISVRGTEPGAISKDDGSFTVTAPDGAATLVARRIGYRRREVVVPPDRASVEIALERDVLQLEAVVVTGQATGQERRNLANAVATVSGDQVNQVPSQDVEPALQ